MPAFANGIGTIAKGPEYLEAVIERARASRYPQGVAGYLDPHAIGFVDCKPDRKA